MSLTDPSTWLLVVAGAHLGFQLTVSLVVYPALREVDADAWSVAHERHSRRIAPLVGALYVPLVLVLASAAVAEPEASGTWLALVAPGEKERPAGVQSGGTAAISSSAERRAAAGGGSTVSRSASFQRSSSGWKA